METTVPRVSGAEAQSLGTALITAHHKHGKGKDARVDKRAQEVADATKVLAELSAKTPEVAEQSRKEADLRCDDIWRSTQAWLTGWSTVRSPLAPLAAQLKATLFPDGLAFINLTFEAQWSEQQHRLDAIAKTDLEPAFAKLGGADFLAELKASHTAYGQVLNITSATKAPLPVPIAPALKSLVDSIGRYLTALKSFADDGSEQSSLAELLAEPVERFRATRSSPATPPPPPVSPTV